MSLYMLKIARFRFGLATLWVVGTSLLVMLLSASVALQAQDKSTSPKAGAQTGAATIAVADKSSQPSPATASKAADQGQTSAPGWMDRLLESSEEVQHVDAPGTPPHEHPADQAAPHEHPAEEVAPHEHPAGQDATAPHEHPAGGAEHGVVTADVPTVLLLLGLTLGFALGMLLWVRLAMRPSDTAGDAPPSNILDWPVIGKLLRWRHFNALLIFPTLAIFLFIVVVGLAGQQDTSNPAVLLTWILWWPAVIFSFIVLGRIWCVMCPFGYVGDLTQKVFSLRRKVPKFLKNMWWRLGLFLALTWSTTLFHLDRWPWGTAWLALALTLGAIFLGVLFQKRTFCRYVCPVGGIFGLYAMTTPVRIGVKDKRLCQQKCPEKDCARVCNWFEFAPTIERNMDCNLCLDCVRVCPHDNIVLKGQSLGTDLAEFVPRRKSLDEGATVAAVLGVSVLQTAVMLNAWPEWQDKVAGWLGIPPGPILYTVIFLTFGLVVPSLLVALIASLGAPRETLRDDAFRAFRTYAYIFLPLGLALHAAHNFHHLFGEGGAMVAGLRRALAGYTGWANLAPSATAGTSPTIGPNILFTLQWLALIGGMYLAFYVGVTLIRHMAPKLRPTFRTALPIFLFTIVYTVANVLILAAPMAHRH